MPEFMARNLFQGGSASWSGIRRAVSCEPSGPGTIRKPVPAAVPARRSSSGLAEEVPPAGPLGSGPPPPDEAAPINPEAAAAGAAGPGTTRTICSMGVIAAIASFANGKPSATAPTSLPSM